MNKTTKFIRNFFLILIFSSIIFSCADDKDDSSSSRTSNDTKTNDPSESNPDDEENNEGDTSEEPEEPDEPIENNSPTLQINSINNENIDIFYGNSTSESIEITITNQGIKSENLNEQITIIGDNTENFQFTGENTCNVELEYNQSCKLHIQAIASENGTYSASLKVLIHNQPEINLISHVQGFIDLEYENICIGHENAETYNYFNNTGLFDDPHIICNEKQWKDIALNACGINNDIGCSQYFKLMANINLKGESGYFPIGINRDFFNGQILGNNKTIANFVIENNTNGALIEKLGSSGAIHDINILKFYIMDNIEYSGIISKENYGNIDNIVIQDLNVLMNGNNLNNFGLICHKNQGIIQNINIQQEITINKIKDNVGGIVSINETGATISNINFSNTTFSYVDDVTNFGIISSFNKGLIQNAYIQDSVLLENLINSQNIGGISGINQNGEIQKSYTKILNIIHQEDSINLGGLIGFLDGGKILNSYAHTNITSNNGSNPVNTIIGGLVGKCNNNAQISKNYFIGTINAGTSNTNSGQILGYNLNCSNSSYNYWNSDYASNNLSTANPIEYSIIDVFEGKTNTEMQTETTFQKWNFQAIWIIDTINFYPTIK